MRERFVTVMEGCEVGVARKTRSVTSEPCDIWGRLHCGVDDVDVFVFVLMLGKAAHNIQCR